MNIYLFCLFDCLFVGLFVLPLKIFSTFVILKRKNRHISFQILFLVVSNLYANYKNSESNFKQHEFWLYGSILKVVVPVSHYAKSGFYNKSLVLTNRFRYPVLILFYVALVNNVHDKWLKRRCRYWMNNRKRLKLNCKR